MDASCTSSVRPTKMPLLPQEIMDSILDHVNDNHEAMRACSLVCRAWTTPSQKYLFEKLRIDLYIRPKSCTPPFRETVRFAPSIRPLYKAATINPHLLSHVKSLTLRVCGDIWRYRNFMHAPAHFMESRTAKSWFRHLPQILLGLTNLEQLEFSNSFMYPLLTICPKPVHTALLSLFHRPSLTSFKMLSGSALELFAILQECPKVTRLSLGMITCSSITPYPRVPALELDTLAVSSGKLPLLRLLNKEFPSQKLIKYDRLNRLQIHVSMCSIVDLPVIDTAEDLLLRNMETLEHIALNIYLNAPLHQLVDLSRLRSVTFTLDPAMNSSEGITASEQWADWLVQSFCVLPGTVGIEECTLQLVHFYIREDLECHEESWKILDGLMALWPSFKTLKVFNQWSRSSSSAPRLCGGVGASVIGAMFPLLAQSGKLVTGS